MTKSCDLKVSYVYGWRGLGGGGFGLGSGAGLSNGVVFTWFAVVASLGFELGFCIMSLVFGNYIVSGHCQCGNRTVTQMRHSSPGQRMIGSDNRLPVQCWCVAVVAHRARRILCGT